MIVALQKSLMSLQVVVSVCWSSFWRGCRWTHVMSNSRLEHISQFHRATYFPPSFLMCLGKTKVFVPQVLKIFIHLCSHGSDQFLTELRRNSTFIQQASGSSVYFINLSLIDMGPLLLSQLNFPFFYWTVHSGPPDPIHGTELYQKVRNTAQVRCRLYWSNRIMQSLWQEPKNTLDIFFYVQEVARLLFTDTISIKGDITSAGLVPTTMGEQQQEHTYRHQFTLIYRSFKRTLIASWKFKNNGQFLFLLQVWAQ